MCVTNGGEEACVLKVVEKNMRAKSSGEAACVSKEVETKHALMGPNICLRQ
jgi:hypothetical protein